MAAKKSYLSSPSCPSSQGAQAYRAHANRALLRMHTQSKSAREIGPLPKVANRRRRNKCKNDFKLFCETYYKESFQLAWSADHLKAIGYIQDAVINGDQLAIALPRGTGKTTLIKAAAVWALLYGYRKFVAVIANNQELSHAFITDTFYKLSEPDSLLAKDFPEVCYPLIKLENITHRSRGQTLNGKHTNIRKQKDTLILPTVPKSACSASLLMARGIETGIRGLTHRTADGIIRPDLALIDDPQSDETAASETEVQKRENVINKTVLGLAGPGKRIAALAAVTVIQRNDLADRMLNKQENPQWRSHRGKLVYSFPADMTLWNKYQELWRECAQAEERDFTPANDFYASNREAMDAGSRVAWPERYVVGKELSALQHAINLMLLHGDDAFQSEYQNDPVARYASTVELTSMSIASRLSGLERYQLPPGESLVTAAIDVQDESLWYVVTAWAEAKGYVVDYGVYPAQDRTYFYSHKLDTTLSKLYPTATQEQRTVLGLNAVLTKLFTQFSTLKFVGIDAGGKSGPAVHSITNSAQWRKKTWSCFGRVNSNGTPFEFTAKVVGETRGTNYRIKRRPHPYVGWNVLLETNALKSKLARKLLCKVDAPEALTIYGTNKIKHELFAQHLCAEYEYTQNKNGFESTAWQLKSNSLDNHWWDALYYCLGMAYCGGLNESLGEVVSAKISQPKATFGVTNSRANATNKPQGGSWVQRYNANRNKKDNKFDI